jgi:hypothetical protein
MYLAEHGRRLMLRHWTFTADDPQNVANVLAEIFDGEVVEPPRPPWGPDTLWVCMFDEVGTMLEIAPTGSAWVPSDVAPAVETRLDEPIPRYSFNHTFWDCAVSFERLREICEEQGWRTYFQDGIRMKFQAVWVENRTFLELCPKDMIHLYEGVYGTAGRDSIKEYVNLRFGTPPASAT